MTSRREWASAARLIVKTLYSHLGLMHTGSQSRISHGDLCDDQQANTTLTSQAPEWWAV